MNKDTWPSYGMDGKLDGFMASGQVARPPVWLVLGLGKYAHNSLLVLALGCAYLDS